MGWDMINWLGGLGMAQLTLYPLLHRLEPFLVPTCFVAAWAIVGMGAWTVWTAVRDGVARGRRMHQIPCANCQYFSGDYHLKCPVHPTVALSEGAIGCPDFDPKR